jgi:hypothetical protein
MSSPRGMRWKAPAPAAWVNKPRYLAGDERPAKFEQCDKCEEPGLLALVVDWMGERPIRLCDAHFADRGARLRNDGCDVRWKK